MKKLFCILLFWSLHGTFGQTPIQDPGITAEINQTAQEQIFIHFNTALLFSGEYLYYKVYNIDSRTGLMSTLSKLGYVELIGENGNRVFRHKIRLEDGLGQGDYFIPTSLPSGNYKLVGYTRWMKNGEQHNFFQNDIAIINPYRGDQSAFTPGTTSVTQIDSSRFERNEHLPGPATEENENLELTLDREVVGTRESVMASVRSKTGASGYGNYSVSVRKVDPLGPPERNTSESFSGSYNSGQPDITLEDTLYLPELRGSILSGRIERKDPEGGPPVVNQKVALSIPGEDFALKVSMTNEDGRFQFNIMEEYSREEALIQIIGDNKEAYVITLDPEDRMDHTSMDFGEFHISPEMKEQILQRSVYNQIENAYYSIRPDTVQTPLENDPFYAEEPERYDLDAYTRFRTIRETFIEIINSSWITRNKEGDPVIEVRRLEGAIDYGLPPLLLVDGIMVQDHSHFINYPAARVQSIGIHRNNFYLGPHIFQGIVDVRTIEGEYQEVYSRNYLKTIELENPQPLKSYFQQMYGDNATTNSDRLPDFRSQLLWMPSLQLEEEGIAIPFFTSDVTGTFEISVEGFTIEGKPCSLRGYLKVE